MQFAVIILLAVCIGMPLYYARRVWRADERSLAGWLLNVVEASLVVALVLLFGRWDMAGYHLRLLLPLVFAAAVLRSVAGIAHAPGCQRRRR
jgi:hypothetical protein